MRRDQPGGAGLPAGALGALTAGAKAGQLYTVTDSAYANTRILSVDASRHPAQITAEKPVTKDGAQASYDAEGIWRAPAGSFWLGVEGITGNADGSVLYIAMQREAKGEDVARLGRDDVVAGTFTWYGYRLERPSTDSDWIGLSEVTMVDADTLAVIERDKLSGPAAKVKRIYTVDLTRPRAADGQPLPVLDKKLAHDVLPDLAAPNGWVQEKLEGMTIDARGGVHVITDNDGLKDNTGETFFANLGRVVR